MKRSKKGLSQTVRQCLRARELRWRAHQTQRHLQLCGLDPSDRRTDAQRGRCLFIRCSLKPLTPTDTRKESRFSRLSVENGLLKSLKLQEAHLFF